MRIPIQQALTQIGDTSPITTITPISGGDINAAYHVVTKQQEYFVKGNQSVPRHFFRVEAKGLQLIADTGTAHVPKVYYYDEPTNGETGVMILEWIEGRKKEHTEEKLGYHLARMHQTYGKGHGFDEDTFIGLLPQSNGLYDQWIDYYHECRLIPQYNLAMEQNHMDGSRKQRMKKLMDRLHQWVDGQAKPSLLHGDLWGGNWITGRLGEPYLIDPSICYGDHAFELAFTELFGGFSPAFYRIYEELLPLPDHYEDVKPIYQLYYLMVHLNIFGESYGGSVDQILKRYIE